MLGKAVRCLLVEAVGRSYEVVGGTYITIRIGDRVHHPATRRLGGGDNPTAMGVWTFVSWSGEIPPVTEVAAIGPE